MSTATRRAAKARRRQGRGLNQSLPSEELGPARATIGEAFDVGVDLGLLDIGEQREVVAFCRRIRFSEKGPAAPPARADVERLAAWAESAKGREPHAQLQKNIDILVEHAQAVGRFPDAATRTQVLANRDLNATPRSLGLPVSMAGQVIRRGIRLEVLNTPERFRLEQLVEAAAGVEPGEHFEKRRQDQRFRTKLAEIAARAAPGPRKRRLFDEPGTVVLPAELLTDLFRTDGEEVAMTAAGLAVLSFVLLCLENRRVPPDPMGSGVVKLEDDDRTLVVRKGQSAWGMANPLNRVQIWPEALEDCRRSAWLSVTSDGQWTRISLGDRMIRFLEKRQEVPS